MNRLKNYIDYSYISNNNISESYNVKRGTLDVKNNNLTSLSEFPKGVRSIDCEYNDLTSLPELPQSVISLNCSANEITSLPELPDGLITLICRSNNLTYLPKLPNNLKALLCGNNKLTSLPELPDGLITLYCSDNPLECLIPTELLQYQLKRWLDSYYFPYIYSYKGQKNILTKQPHMVKQLEEQTKIHPKIKDEFKHLFTGSELNLF